MRNALLMISLCSLLLGGCSGGGQNTQSKADTPEDTTTVTENPEPAAPQEAAPKTVPPFEKSLKEGPVTFTLYSTNVPEKNTLTVAPSGFEVRNDTFRMEVEGLVYDARLADLDKDGYPEAYAFARSTARDSTSYVYAFSSYRNRSYGPVGVSELSSHPEMARGFNGHGHFFFEGGALKRSFPIYGGGRKTGKQRIVTYALRQGEASFVLEPVSSVEEGGN